MTTSAAVPLAGHVPFGGYLRGPQAQWAMTEFLAGRLGVTEYVDAVQLAARMAPRDSINLVSSGTRGIQTAGAYQGVQRGPGPFIVKGLHSLYDFGKSIADLYAGHDGADPSGHDSGSRTITTGYAGGHQYLGGGYDMTLNGMGGREGTVKRNIPTGGTAGHTGAGSTMFSGAGTASDPYVGTGRPKGVIPGYDGNPGGHDDGMTQYPNLARMGTTTYARSREADFPRSASRTGHRVVRYPKRRAMRTVRRRVVKRRKAVRRTRRRAPNWVDSLNDPCHVVGMKIPDGTIFPTRTAQVKIIRTIGVSVVEGQAIVEVNPIDLFVRLDDAGATSHLVHKPDIDTNGAVTNAVGVRWTKSFQDAEPDIVDLHNNAIDLRIVSACMKAHYMGSTHDDQGTITGGQTRGSTFFDDDTEFPGFGALKSIDAFQDAASSKVFPLRDGCEVKWAPANKDDTDFTRVFPQKTSTDRSLRTTSSGMAIAINGAAGNSVPIRLEIFINVEYTPRHGVSAGTVSGGFSQWVLNMASRWAGSTDNMIHKVQPFVDPIDYGAVMGAAPGVIDSAFAGMGYAKKGYKLYTGAKSLYDNYGYMATAMAGAYPFAAAYGPALFG